MSDHPNYCIASSLISESSSSGTKLQVTLRSFIRKVCKEVHGSYVLRPRTSEKKSQATKAEVA